MSQDFSHQRPTIPSIVERLAHDLDAQVDFVSPVLPDGSGFATLSMPLPADHWCFRTPEEPYEAPPMPFRMGWDDPRRQEWEAHIRSAGRYAYRAATMGGQDFDLDPDALIQNLVVGLLGYWTSDGLSEDTWANPDPIPPFVERA